MYADLIINNKVMTDHMSDSEDLKSFIKALELSLEYARRKYIKEVISKPDEMQKIIDMMG